ncbi:cytoplasmic tRNA 2-thiolation protein 2 [Orbilia oligospora]|uniref:Cytoplasmic tRNA 2-thiolation protein 2 n=1 Tax=Orbilia oligospora TaxID=2813651 RepID=A0A6G1MEP8_ORBOL|nr:cytoplasmic tRNA 2-thiolation protein 2 [Orbilia oligospora]KAF3224069.1 cytoplasmic tRNA 2-thiolation protein 2 [Orbilia oligospora]KAF3255852.1 cytoplasmic tRNA 2-thiolation protein 2 [Orbilia oligospora]
MEFEVTMADIAKLPRKAAQNLCKRCNLNPPEITMRHEALCRDCFQIYIRTKFTRHMEPYRVKKHSQTTKKLLLATSLGVSSTVLLDTLHWHRALQVERARRSEYDVYVVHIDETAVTGDVSTNTSSSSTDADTITTDQCLEKLKERYTQFEFIKVPLEEIYTISGSTATATTLVDEIISTTSEISIDPTTTSSSSSAAALLESQPPRSKLRTLLSSLNSRASQMDLINILRTRLIIELAKQRDCEAIFFADSMTKMAAMVLAEVTKGRGHALPWLISDGPTPYGPAKIVRPFRELSKSEIISYTTFTSLWPYSIISQETATSPQKPPIKAKNQTIDEIMLKFFDDVSNAHLSTNVVKTAAKLEFADDRDRIERLGLCEICGLPMDEDPRVRRLRSVIRADGEGGEGSSGGGSGNGSIVGDADARIYCLEPPAGEEGLKERRCYGCRRSTLGAGKIDWPVNNR